MYGRIAGRISFRLSHVSRTSTVSENGSLLMLGSGPVDNIIGLQVSSRRLSTRFWSEG